MGPNLGLVGALAALVFLSARPAGAQSPAAPAADLSVVQSRADSGAKPKAKAGPPAAAKPAKAPPAKPAPAKTAPGKAAPANPGATKPAAARPEDTPSADSLGSAETSLLRETFTYSGAPRDPFVSLIKTANVGPELSDLLLVAIYQDLRYSGNSVAVLRDKANGKRYKLRPGDQIGRLRVARIGAKDVVFAIQDFGYERQETLSLRKQEDLTP